MRSVKVQHKNPTSSQCSKSFFKMFEESSARNAKDKTLLSIAVTDGHRVPSVIQSSRTLLWVATPPKKVLQAWYYTHCTLILHSADRFLRDLMIPAMLQWKWGHADPTACSYLPTHWPWESHGVNLHQLCNGSIWVNTHIKEKENDENGMNIREVLGVGWYWEVASLTVGQYAWHLLVIRRHLNEGSPKNSMAQLPAPQSWQDRAR